MAIDTARLQLRLFDEQDLPALREIDSEPAVLRYRSHNVITEKMTRRFLTYAIHSSQKDPRTFYAFSVERKEDGAWLGQCGMADIPEKDPREKCVYIWYSLLPRYWGYGYMTEAVQGLIQAGFIRFGLKVISAECEPDNVASYRVMEKAGLLYTGRVQRTDNQDNTIERVHYELSYSDFLKREWPAVKVTEPI